MTKISRILWDLDEVLVDFVGGACEAWGVHKADLLSNWEIGRWDDQYDIRVPMGKTLLQYGKRLNEEMMPVEFWSRINDNEAFWESLRPHPWMMELIQLGEKYTKDWHIVTAPSSCVSSYHGKIKFLKRIFGSSFDRFCITPHKEIMSDKGVVLVDDREWNCFVFECDPATGLHRRKGQSILFPAFHNYNHNRGVKGQEVPWVEEQLEWYSTIGTQFYNPALYPSISINLASRKSNNASNFCPTVANQ